jgi:hypothetical protein
MASVSDKAYQVIQCIWVHAAFFRASSIAGKRRWNKVEQAYG